jgi:hypothetical protein
MSKCEEIMRKFDHPGNIELDDAEVHTWRKGKRDYKKALLDFKTHLLIGEGTTCEIVPISRIDMIVVSNVHRIEIRDIVPPSDDELLETE